MFIDARTLPEGTALDADICIIGGGAAGITLARDQAGSGRKVILLESGGLDFSEKAQELYDGQVAGQPLHPLSVERLRFFGGSTNHWSGGCRPFDPSDFEPRPYIEQSGWPFRRQELDAYYRKAQKICQLGPYTYAPGDWASEGTGPLPLPAEAKFHTGIIQYSPPTRFGEVYRRDLERGQGITVYLNANVVDIEVNENASEVQALRVACLNGKRFRARARTYVLAVGGIENPRLLLSANGVQKTGLGNTHDLVGRYFMDHPYIANAATLVVARDHAAFGFYRQRRVRSMLVQAYLYPSAKTQREERLPLFGVSFSPGSFGETGSARESLVSIYQDVTAGRWPDNFGYHLGQILHKAETEAQEKYYQWTGSEPELFSTHCMFECPPNRESRVSLTDAVDALGMRRVRVDWKLPTDFESTLRRGLTLLSQDLGRADLGRLRINVPEGGTGPYSWLENGYHHMGTTRMHDDPQQGVVDGNCRVHGMANLYIGGSSLFPTYSCDNPTMTIVALALRLSDHLKANHPAAFEVQGAIR